jgi:type II secretion system-associated lipoprotein
MCVIKDTNVKKTGVIILMIICGLIFSSCTTFLKKDDISNIKNYEKKEYILRDDAGEGNRLIKKGSKIKLYIITGDDYIKVYVYPSKTEFVKAERALIVYIFEDDFEKSKFKIDVFENKLYGKVELAK